MDDRLYQDVEDELTQAATGRKKRPGVRVWQNEKKKLRSKVDPFVILVFLYVLFSISCLTWFGWKYYTLKREVARLSGIILTLYEDQAPEPTMSPPVQKEPANSPNPLPGGQTVPEQTDEAAAASTRVAETIMYTVKEGDSWWKISEKYYGVGSYYLKLPVYNKLNNQSLYKGLTVEIPPKEVLDAMQ